MSPIDSSVFLSTNSQPSFHQDGGIELVTSLADALRAMESPTYDRRVLIKPDLQDAMLPTMMFNFFMDLAEDEPLFMSVERLVAGRSLSSLSADEMLKLWSNLHRHKWWLQDKAAVLAKLSEACLEIGNLFEPLVPFLDYDLPEPNTADDFLRPPLMAPLISFFDSPAVLVEQIITLFTENDSAASRLFIKQYFTIRDTIHKLPPISESDLPIKKLIEKYLAGTPFVEFLYREVRIPWEHEHRYNHTHILGGSGSGKTTLIEWMIWQDFIRDCSYPDDRRSVVIIDPHSQLLRTITHSGLTPLPKMILIDPRDMDYPPAVNIFAVNKERFASYDARTREQMTAAVISTLDYFFRGLIGVDLTPKQGILLRYLVRFLLSFPDSMGRNATIIDMLRFLEDPDPYRDAVEALPELQRDFFRGVIDPKQTTWKETKNEIKYRLQAILENPILAQFFTSSETKLDLFTALNDGAMILIDTAEDFLKDASPLFGRLWISLILQAIMERSVLKESERLPTFFYIDEAADYFDQNIDDLLTSVRKFNCGCVLSHQYLEQATGALRASLASNTSTKFVSGLSAGDARAMASEMHTTPEFILSQPKLHFAAYLHGRMPHAVSIEVKRSPFSDSNAKKDIARHDQVVSNSRRRISNGKPSHPTSQPTPHSPQTPDEDISEKW